MLIERESSLQSLQTIAQGCREGQGRIVILAGEAGIGKTALLREFERSAGNGIKILWGGCEALFTPRPLGPLQDMAKSIDPRIAALLDEGAAQDRIFPALLNALQDSKQTHVLIFEDVHWADNATLDLIKYLGRRIALLRVMLVLTLRNDEVGKTHPLTHVLGDLPSRASTRLLLEPLTPQGVAQLAGPANNGGFALYDVTAGNPFFVSEILAAGRANNNSKIPDSIRDAVWSRIARLPDGARELLEVMSIVPGGMELWLARKLIGEQSDRAAEEVTTRGMVQQSSQGFLKFRHELARQATLDGLSADAQKKLHTRILDAMAQGAPDGSSLPVTRFVHHAAGAEDHLKVLELAPRAATQAAKLGAHREAASHLAMALKYVDDAPPELAAQLYESWAYEAGVALRIDESILAARHHAIELWRKAGRHEKVGLNLRWVARLHWYRGETQEADTYVDQALRELQDLPAGPELAMAYSARSQLHMLNDRLEEAITWGERAITLARELGEMETRIHALNNVGTSLYLTGQPGGRERHEESLSLSLEHGFHEQAARAYTNFAECAILFKDFALAERLLADGLSFYARHDLAWSHQLVGRHAQLRLEQGRFREAETIASGIIGLERPTMVMKLPALTVLGIARVRLGEADGHMLLEQALLDAEKTGEPQNISPVLLGFVEEAWLNSDFKTARQHLATIEKMDINSFDNWKLGAFATWWKRCAMAKPFPVSTERLHGPRVDELQNDASAAAEEWLSLGQPYEAALALMQTSGQPASAALGEAVTLLENMEARPAAALARTKAKQLGVSDAMPKMRRGPYSAARSHPLGLTHREVEVLGFVAQGLGNQEIARRIVRSQKTVEHHVSAVLGKLNAGTRMDVVLRLQSEPWLLSSRQN